MLKIDSQSLNPYKDAFRQSLSDLVAIPSVKGEPCSGAPFGQETVRALDYLLGLATAAGFSVHRQDGFYGWLEWGRNDAPIIAALGHLDVVPAGDWEKAFKLDLAADGDTVYGRGVADDKGPLLAAFFALKYLKDQGYQPRHRLRLIAGLDEESGSHCLAHYRQVDELPLYAFTPDADFPVISAEKGLLHIRIRFSASQPFTLEGGTRPNVVPGRAHLTLKQGNELVFLGRQAHASTPEKGLNAISLAMEALSREAACRDLPAIRAYQNLVGLDCHGKKLGIACCDEPSGPLTLNVGLVQAGPEGAEFILDIRYPVTASPEDIVKKISEAFIDYGAEVTCLADSKPLHLQADHPLVKTLGEVYGDLTELDSRPIGIGGGTYARSLPNTVAFGAVFPGEDSQMHQTGEVSKISNLLKAGAIYAEAFRRLDQLD